MSGTVPPGSIGPVRAAAGDLAGAAPGVLRAEAVRRYLAGHRRRRRPSLFTIYVIVLCGAVFGLIGEGVLKAVVGGGLGQREVAQCGPAVLTLLLLAAVRFGVWQGPVSFRVPDVILVLLAPLSITSLVRTRLNQALIVAAATGAAVGTAIALLASGGVASVGAGRAVGVVVGVAALGALAVALSWLVEVSADLTRTAARAGPLLVIGALVPLVAAAGRVGTAVVAWSGPWGWATQPFTGRPGWPVATALLLAVALAAVSAARRRTRAATPVAFLGRAEVRTGMATAAFALDYRGVALHRRGAGGAGAGGAGRGGVGGGGAGGRAGHFSDGSSEKRPPAPRGFRHFMPGPLTIPRPRSARLAIPWRDALTALRAPTRLGAAALVMAACVTEAASHPGRGLPAGLAAVGLYAAAALLCEPLRDDVDRPDRGAVLLSRRFASLLLGHCVVPMAILVASGAVTVVVLFAAGVVGPLALLMIPTLLPAAAAVAVLSAALATRRGGRVDGDVLGRLMIVDPSSPAFGAAAVVVLAPWLLVSGAVLGVTIALLGRAVTHHGQVVAAGIDVTSVAVVAALVLLRIAWRSPRP